MAGAEERGTRVVGVAGAIHALVAVAEMVAFALAGSWILLADAARAAVAAAHHGLVLRAARRVASAGAGHPDGHGAEHHYWPAVLAGVATAVVAGMALYRGVGLALEPATDAIRQAPTLAVLVAGGVAGVVALVLAVRAADEVRGLAGWFRFTHHAPSPILPVALAEGLAGVLAPLLGAAAVGALLATEERTWEGVGVAVVGAVAAAVATTVAVTSRSLLIGRSASRRYEESVAAAIEVDPAVNRLVQLSTRHDGPASLLVAARVELDHTLTFPEVCEVLHRIERHVRKAVPGARTMYVEPTVDVARRAAPTVDEHLPGHEVPEEIRRLLEEHPDPGALGAGIPLEDDTR